MFFMNGINIKKEYSTKEAILFETEMSFIQFLFHLFSFDSIFITSTVSITKINK